MTSVHLSPDPSVAAAVASGADMGQWAAELQQAWNDSTALAVGRFDRTGQPLYLNQGMRAVLGGDLPDRPRCDYLLNPPFTQLLAADADGLIFTGCLTFGDHYQVSRTLQGLKGRVYRQGEELLIVAEYDVLEYARLEHALLRTNQEVNNLQRTLLRKNARLAQTLAELDHQRQHLEQQVEERTRQLMLAKEAAETANVAKSAFLANMSHETRTPLNAILGMTYLVKRSGVTPQQADRLDKIETAGQHLLEILSAMLEFSKLEAGRLVLDEVEVDIAALVTEVASCFVERAADNGIFLIVDALPLPQPLLGDAARLRQALVEYIDNAIRFTPGGTIHLRAEVTAETQDSVMIRFEVEDTGIGIAAEILPKLFTSFEQADNSITRQHGGAGLGLAFIKKLAQMMGGDAGAVSTPGVGSTFWFSARLGKQPAAGR